MNTTKVINVVAGLIYQNDRLLVCQRRADGAFPLKWEFPGGKVEEREAEIDALRRELREELTIEMREAVLVYQHTHRYLEGPTVSLRFYFIHAFDGDAQNVVFEKISWVKVADLEHIDFLEGDRPIIEKLLVEGDSLLLGK
jgi:8-oxo-dGTP diphosphatase